MEHEAERIIHPSEMKFDGKTHGIDEEGEREKKNDPTNTGMIDFSMSSGTASLCKHNTDIERERHSMSRTFSIVFFLNIHFFFIHCLSIVAYDTRFKCSDDDDDNNNSSSVKVKIDVKLL